MKFTNIVVFDENPPQKEGEDPNFIYNYDKKLSQDDIYNFIGLIHTFININESFSTKTRSLYYETDKTITILEFIPVKLIVSVTYPIRQKFDKTDLFKRTRVFKICLGLIFNEFERDSNNILSFESESKCSSESFSKLTEILNNDHCLTYCYESKQWCNFHIYISYLKEKDADIDRVAFLSNNRVMMSTIDESDLDGLYSLYRIGFLNDFPLLYTKSGERYTYIISDKDLAVILLTTKRKGKDFKDKISLDSLSKKI